MRSLASTSGATEHLGTLRSVPETLRDSAISYTRNHGTHKQLLLGIGVGMGGHVGTFRGSACARSGGRI